MKNKKYKDVKTFLIISTDNSLEFSPQRWLVPQEDVWNSFTCEEKNIPLIVQELMKDDGEDKIEK